MRDLTFTRQQDANAFVKGIETMKLYPQYFLAVVKPPHCRRWKIACSGMRDGNPDAFLTYYKA